MLMFLKIIQEKVKIWSVSQCSVKSVKQQKMKGFLFNTKINSIPQRKILRNDEVFVPFIFPFCKRQSAALSQCDFTDYKGVTSLNTGTVY